MKITGAKSYILVEYDHRSLKIMGELTTTPSFYADKCSIKSWESPYDSVLITQDEKDEIINRITLETRDTEFKIYFE